MKDVYIAGDMLKKGSQLLREKEKEKLQAAGIPVHSPSDDKEINDKSKDPKAEDIFEKDTYAIVKAKNIIVDADDDNVGTSVEVGQIWGINFMLDVLEQTKKQIEGFGFVNDDFKAGVSLLAEALKENIPHKQVYWQNTDIRNVEGIQEEGLRRSFSLNQYLHGCLLDMAGEDKDFDEIVKEIQQKLADEKE